MSMTMCKYELNELVDTMGWAEALRFLADKAREEGESGISASLHLFADVMDSGSSSAAALGLLDGLDDPQGPDPFDVDVQYPVHG